VDTFTVNVSPILVASVSLSTTAVTLQAGGTATVLTPVFTPSNATNQNVTWSSNNDIATVSNGTVTPSLVSMGTSVITVTTDDGGFEASCTVTVTGLIVGNVEWAVVNVNDFQTFADRPDMYTKYYQWNKADRPYAAEGPVSPAWEGAANTDAMWNPDPCPEGWQLPTNTEFVALHNSSTATVGGTWRPANARGNAVAGRFYGPNAANCSLPDNMQGCIFLPACSSREYSMGSLGSQGTDGSYWTAVQMSAANGRRLYFTGASSNAGDNVGKAVAMSLRCVKTAE